MRPRVGLRALGQARVAPRPAAPGGRPRPLAPRRPDGHVRADRAGAALLAAVLPGAVAGVSAASSCRWRRRPRGPRRRLAARRAHGRRALLGEPLLHGDRGRRRRLAGRRGGLDRARRLGPRLVHRGLASAVISGASPARASLSDTAEGRAQRLVAIQFFVLAPYVPIESVTTLVEGGHADITVIGMALTGDERRADAAAREGQAPARRPPRLDRDRRRGHAERPLRAPGRRRALGLAANAAFGAWWLDPLAGLFIAFVALKEGRGGLARRAVRLLPLSQDEAGAGAGRPATSRTPSSAAIITSRIVTAAAASSACGSVPPSSST